MDARWLRFLALAALVGAVQFSTPGASVEARPCYEPKQAGATPGPLDASCDPNESPTPPRSVDPNASPPPVVVTLCAPIPNAHVEAAGVTVGQDLWVVSGSVNSSSNNPKFQLPTARTDILDMASCEWRSGPKVNIPRICYPNVFNVKGTLFLVGGLKEMAPYSGKWANCREVEVCRPDGAGFKGLGVTIPPGDRNWHQLPSTYSMPTGYSTNWHRSTATHGDSLFLFYEEGTLKFNTATGAWSTRLATFPGANHHFSCAVTLGDRIYLAGGDDYACCKDGKGGQAVLFSEYDPARNAFRKLPDFPKPGLAEHTIEVLDNASLMTVGGDYAGTKYFHYAPEVGKLQQLEVKVPAGRQLAEVSRSDHVSGVFGTKVVLVGGIVAGTKLPQPETVYLDLPGRP